jgi:HD superfamily phosphohydrolase
VIRIGALLHDIGHLPFSHAAEEALLPEGWSHERLTAEMIRQPPISEIVQKSQPPVDPEDVVAVAWDFKKRAIYDPKFTLDPWKTLLNELICGNTFGADRIDYLLRDSLHLGVAYGRFDLYRLISGLCILIDQTNDEVAIGMDIGAIHAAEALLLARYFMYTQVYFHDVRRVYDLHLKEFLQHWLPGGQFPSNWEEMLRYTDNEVLAALHESAQKADHGLHEFADRLMSRGHFRTIYELVPPHKQKCPTIFEDLRKFVEDQFGSDRIRSDYYVPKSEANDFPVLLEDGGQESSQKVSGVIAQIPSIEFGLIFAAPSVRDKAKKVIDEKIRAILDSPNPAGKESRR